ncbi:hypothetical protein [Xanthobacter sp. 126]|uniref:hypothetical protein n=1 Tax=Xanthobacter sp. 126 TaxID=1131814 RepID=UPI0018CC17C9|nr:hypothetical protein [Xanthobacter sp. 126]
MNATITPTESAPAAASNAPSVSLILAAALGYLKKIKIADKRAALVDIGRHLGMFNDSLKLKGDAENPLTLVIQQLQGSAIKPVDVVPEELPALFGRH